MQFQMIMLNIRSLQKHFLDLNVDMYAQRSTHICVVETWIDPETWNGSEFTMPGRIF